MLGDRLRRMADVLDAVVLPERRPRGDPENNWRRLLPVAALHQARVKRLEARHREWHRKNCPLCKVRVPKVRS